MSILKYLLIILYITTINGSRCTTFLTNRISSICNNILNEDTNEIIENCCKHTCSYSSFL